MKKAFDSMRRAATNATRNLVPGSHSPQPPSTPSRRSTGSRPVTPAFAISPPAISSPPRSPTSPPDLSTDGPTAAAAEPEDPQVVAATADPLVVKVLTAKELATLTVQMEQGPSGRTPVQQSNRAILEVLLNLVKVRGRAVTGSKHGLCASHAPLSTTSDL